MVPEWLTKIQTESGATENLPLFADDEEDVLVAGYTCIKTLFGADIAYRQIKEDLLARYEDMKQKYILDNRKFLPALWVSFFDGIGLTYEHNTRVFSVNGADFVPDYYFPQMDCYFKLEDKEKAASYRTSEFVRGVDGFSLLVAFGDPHEMNTILICEYAAGDKTRKGWTKALFAKSSISKSQRGLYVHGDIMNEFYKSIEKVGYTKDDGFHTISAATLWMKDGITAWYTEYRKKDILDTYSNDDLAMEIGGHYYIHSDFRDKDLVKEFGARWDADVELWYFDSLNIRNRCCEELKEVEAQRAREHEERRQTGLSLIMDSLKKAGYENLVTQKEKDALIDQVWRRYRDEYRFTKKEVKQFVTEYYSEERE